MAVSARFMASLRNHTSLFLTCTTFDGQVKIALSVPGRCSLTPVLLSLSPSHLELEKTQLFLILFLFSLWSFLNMGLHFSSLHSFPILPYFSHQTLFQRTDHYKAP